MYTNTIKQSFLLLLNSYFHECTLDITSMIESQRDMTVCYNHLKSNKGSDIIIVLLETIKDHCYCRICGKISAQLHTLIMYTFCYSNSVYVRSLCKQHDGFSLAHEILATGAGRFQSCISQKLLGG